MALTTNLADFGYRELKEAKEILEAWIDGKGLPEDFDDSGVVIAFNQDSGYVFLTNDEYQVAMVVDDGTLESWYTLTGTGEEGFFDDLYAAVDYWDLDDAYVRDDLEELISIAENLGKYEEAAHMQELLDDYGESDILTRSLEDEDEDEE